MKTIYFTKLFKSGVLKGLCHTSQASFSELSSCALYKIGATGKDVITGTKWVIVDASFQKYAR